MKRFTQLFQQVDATTSTNEKIRALQAYFQAEEARNAVWALYLLLGKTRKRLITSRSLRDIFLQISDIPEWLFEDCYAQVGDTAEVIALLLPSTLNLLPAFPSRPARSSSRSLWQLILPPPCLTSLPRPNALTNPCSASVMAMSS